MMESEIQKNVSFVPADFMCTGCGTCVAVCPHDVIHMYIDEKKGVYQSKVDLDACTNCTKCLKSCPPLTWSNKQKTQQYNFLVGDYIGSYAAFSNDREIRRNSASGGFITSFLVYLLKNKIIDAAVVVKRDEENPLISVPFIATRAQEIVNANGSKYSPVKFDEIIKEVLNSKYKKLAVVGLPCHIEGLAKASINNKKLKSKIKYKISIVCGQSPSFLGYEYIAKKLNIEISKIKKIKNRGDGWPGFMQIETKDRFIKVPYGSKYSMGLVLSSPLFTPLACQMCADSVGFEADISVSDAWLDKYMDNKEGINMILVKNPELIGIIEKIRNDNIITFIDEDISSFINANKTVIYNKGKYNEYRLSHFIGKNRNKYLQDMFYHDDLSLIEKIKMIIFIYHLKILKKINIKKVIIYLNDYILLYFKALNLLKR